MPVLAGPNRKIITMGDIMERGQLFQNTFKRILFCTDFSQNAEYAFDYAVDAAMRRPDCELYLLHVIPQSDAQFWKSYIYEVEGVENKAKEDLDRKVNDSYISKLPAGVALKIEYRSGKDYEEILDFAKKTDIDLIVLGRQGHSSIQDALFGKVTEKIVRKAACAVMVIPHTAARNNM